MKKNAIFIIFLLFTSSMLLAGIWDNMLIGTRALSMATAFTGIADDPSAIFYNPGGLAYYNYSFRFSLEGIYVSPKETYASLQGNAVYSESKYPQTFITYKRGKWGFALGFYCPYGQDGVDWEEDRPGIPLKSVLGVYSITPAVSYKLSDKISIGATLNYYYGSFEMETENTTFGSIKTNENGNALSGGFGVLYHPNDAIGIGLTFHGPASLTIKGKSTLMNKEFDSESKVKLPYNLEAGISYKISRNFIIGMDVGYSHRSSMKKLEGKIKNVNVISGTSYDIDKSEEFNFKDIVNLKMGGEYLFNNGIAVRLGMAYYFRSQSEYNELYYPLPIFDSSYNSKSQSKDNPEATNDDVDEMVFMGGVGYSFGKFQLSLTALRAIGKERTMTQIIGPVQTSKKYNLNATVLSLSIGYSN